MPDSRNRDESVIVPSPDMTSLRYTSIAAPCAVREVSRVTRSSCTRPSPSAETFKRISRRLQFSCVNADQSAQQPQPGCAFAPESPRDAHSLSAFSTYSRPYFVRLTMQPVLLETAIESPGACTVIMPCESSNVAGR